jgi:hypothetical protein
MTMSVVSRLNLGAAPYAMVFRSGANVFYRSSNTDLRKANLDAATDAVFANTLQVGGAGSNVVTALHLGGFYCSGQVCANGGGGGNLPKLNFVNLSTAAVSVVNMPEPAVATTWDGTIGALPNKICCAYQPVGSTFRELWSLLPPSHGLVQDGITAGPTIRQVMFSLENHNNSQRLLLGAPAGGNDLTEASFTVRPPPNYFTTAYITPNADGIYTPINYTAQGAGLPWGMREYQGYMYTFAQATTGGQTYPALVRFNIVTGVAEVQILDAANPSLNANFIQNFWIDYQFGRIYWAFSNLGFQLSGASLSTWPLVPDTVLVDTGNNAANSIRGIYTEPPYVYLTKTIGPTYGNQYIRIYDTELEDPHRSRKRGGEFWNIIPEVAPYMSS